MSNKIMRKRIAIVGLGGIGNRHAGSIVASQRGQLVAGVDCNSSTREAFAAKYDVPVYETAEALLAAQEIDGVIIATPPFQREAVLKPFLEAGCSILCEKPLAHTLESACRIRDLVRTLGRGSVHIGFCHRLLGAAQRARELLHDGSLGKIVWMNVVFASNTPDMRERWMTDPALSGGGAAMDNAGHAIDLFRYLVGDPLEVNGFYRNEWLGRGEDSFVVALRGREGALGSILGSYVASTPRLFWEICGTEATLRFDYAGGGDELWKIYPDGTLEMLDVQPARDRFTTQINTWASAMEGQETGLATLEDGYRIAEMMDALMQQGQPTEKALA